MRKFGNPRQEGGHSYHSKPVGTHRRILKQLVDSVGFVNKSQLKMENIPRPQRTNLTSSDCDSDASAGSQLNAHNQSEPTSSLDQVSNRDQQFYDSTKPSKSPETGGEPVYLSGSHVSQSEPQKSPISNVSNSFRSDSREYPSFRPSISLSNENLNHRNDSTVTGRQSTSPPQHFMTREHKSIRQVGSDGIFYISSVLNPVTMTCVRSSSSPHKNIQQSQTQLHHLTHYKPSHERVRMSDQKPVVRNISPMSGAPMYTSRPTAQLLSHLPLHIVRKQPPQTRNIHYTRHDDRSPAIQQQQQHSQSLPSEYKIFRIADKRSHFHNSNNISGRIHLNLQKSPVLVPISEASGGGGSMVTVKNQSSNRPCLNDSTIYVKPVNFMSSSSSTVTTMAQANCNEHHPSPGVLPISTKLSETKLSYVPLTDFPKNGPSNTSEHKFMDNRLLNTDRLQNSVDTSVICKKKRGRPPKSTSTILNRFNSSLSHEIDDNGGSFETSRSQNAFESSGSNLQLSLNLQNKTVNNSSAANVDQVDVSSNLSPNQMPSSSLTNKSLFSVSESLASPSVRVVLNCPYNSANLCGPAPRSPVVTTINMTGVIFKDHLMNESNSIEPLSQVSIFHDHQPGICGQFFSPSLLTPRDETYNIGSNNSTKPVSQMNATENSERSNNNEPVVSHNSDNIHLKTNQNDGGSSEIHETRCSRNTRFSSSARTRSNDSTSSQMSNGITVSSEATCSDPESHFAPTSRRIRVGKHRCGRQNKLRNVKQNPNFDYATTTTGNDPRSTGSHPQRFNGINFDEIENIDCEEKNISNIHDVISSFQQNGSSNHYDDLHKQNAISGSGGFNTQSSSNTKLKNTNIHRSGKYILEFESIPSKNRWVTLGSPIKRTVEIHGRVFDRTFFSSIKLDELTLSVGDSVLLKSDGRSNSLPYVGILAAFWNDVRTIKPRSRNGMKYGSSTRQTLMITVLWYYRPYQTDLHSDASAYGEDELFLSKHMDDNPASCIIEKCYALSYSKYCRYRSLKALKSLKPTALVDPRPFSCLKHQENLSELLESDLQVFFSSRLCDAKTRRVLKRVPSIFPSAEEISVSALFSHPNGN